MAQLIGGILIFLGVHSISIVNEQWRDRMAERGMDRGALMQVVHAIWPDGPQERVNNVWDFVARFGWGWIKDAEQSLDVGKIVHTMMDLCD